MIKFSLNKIQFLFLGLIIFLGCNNKSDKPNLENVPIEKLILGTWHLLNIDPINESKKNAQQDDLLTEANDNELVVQGLIISFFPDSTYTEIKGNGEYEFGKWYFINDGESICFISNETKNAVFARFELENNNLNINLINKTKNAIMKLTKHFDILAEYKKDPFYLSNNLWRIKPNQSESNEQLHERLGNYFKHLAYLLKSSSIRNTSSISFVFSEGIVKIYNGGIGVLNFIPISWEKTFFNEDEANIAYKMFQRYLFKSDYHGASSGDWYKDDYDILISIYGDVKSGKFPKKESI